MAYTESYINLRQKESPSVNTNGDYIGKTYSDKILKTGGELSVFSVYANTQQLDGDTIVITQPLTLSLMFSYIDMDYSSTDKRQLGDAGAWNVTFQPYIAYNNSRVLQLDSIVYETLFPEGINFITVVPRISWVAPDGTHYSQSTVRFDPTNPADLFYYEGVSSPPSPVGIGSATVVSSAYQTYPAKPIQFIEGTLTITSIVNLGSKNPNPTIPIGQVSFQQGAPTTTVISVSSRQLLLAIQSITIPIGIYTRETFAVTFTKLFTDVSIDPTLYNAGLEQLFVPLSKLVIRNDMDPYVEMVLREMPTTIDDIDFTTANTYQYISGGHPPKIIFGARKFSLEYGIAGNVFQLSDAHASMYNSAEPGTENTAVFYLPGPPLTRPEMTKSTGIVIHGFEPASFVRDVLGLDNVVVPLRTDTNGVHYYLQQDIVGKTPTESTSLSMFSSSNDRVITDPTGITYFNTTDIPTNAVIGNQTISSYTGPNIIVRISDLGISQCDYSSASGTSSTVMAVVSTYNNLNGYVTGFPDSTFTIRNYGPDIPISGNPHVEILDADMMPISTLGPDNGVILKIINPYEPIDNKDIKDNTDGSSI